MKNIHVLPTTPNDETANGIWIEKKRDWCNIYITNNEEIENKCYVLSSTSIGALYLDGVINTASMLAKGQWKKIILTTDQDLDNVQAIPDEFLEWFVKNPSCNEVEVFRNSREVGYDTLGNSHIEYSDYKIIIPKEESKPFKDMLPLTEIELAEFKKNPLPTKREWGEPFVNTMPMFKVEPKQETLEEVAERLIPIVIRSTPFGSKFEWKPRKERKAFIKGAKWQAEQNGLGLKHSEALLYNCEKTLEKKIQQERSYSKEEIFDLMNEYADDVIGGCNLRAKSWFEQFKKK